MDEFKVKIENAPSRCEICHKSDFFDVPTGKCLRCASISKEILKVNEKVEIKYNLTKNDHFRFNLYVLPRTPTMKFIGISSLLVITMLMYFTVSVYASFPLSIIVSVIAAIIWLVPFQIVWVLFIFISVSAKGNKTRITDYKLTVGDKFLIEESEYKRDQYNWNAIQKISQNKKYIFLFDTNSSAILIPKRCFTNKEEEIRFFDLLNQFWKKNT